MAFYSLFKKEYNLSKSGFFTGFTDIHTHLLPEVDDGFSSKEESIAALLELQKLGYSRVVFTPHVMSDLQKNDQLFLTESYHAFSSQLPVELQIECRLSAEYMLDDIFVAKHVETEQLLPLSDRHLLVEISQMAYTNSFKELLYQLALAEYYPVLAHPERYSHILKWKDYASLKDQGYLFQLNLLSLSGQYGSIIQSCAELLLKNNMYDFVGSDLHRLSAIKNIASLSVSSRVIEKLHPLAENNHRL